MMDALDFSDLTEDWVSQPRSSDPPQPENDDLLRSSLRSKIPVSSRRSLSSANGALHEKTASDINAKKSINNVKDILPEGFSGTIQHHDAPKPNPGDQVTLEWRNRLLKGNGKSQDLFSAIGLESVFKPPTVKTQTPKKDLTAESTTPSQIPPSSPPVLSHNVSRDLTLASLEDSLQLPPLRAPSQTGPRYGTRKRNTSAVSSNKSAMNHERFSPVVLGGEIRGSTSRQHSAMHKFRNGSRETQRSPSSMSDSVLELPAPHSGDEAESMSLPDYSELDSEQINLDPKFITTKRGGFSRDGSFKVRPLTPSSYQPGLGSSLPVSELPPAPMAPLTPAKVLSTLDEESPQRQKSSGSPLKLFDKYDTFTNDRFNQRISQFQGRADEQAIMDENIPLSPSPRKGQGMRRRQRMSSFGDGELDRFNFTHRGDHGDVPSWPIDVPVGTQHASHTNENYDNPFDENDTQIILESSFSDQIDITNDFELRDIEQESKRAPSSPHRLPDAKRQRTNDQDSQSDSEIQVPRERYLVKSFSTVAGKKRKDARHGDYNVDADPETLAGREILEPVSPYRKLSLALPNTLQDQPPRYIDVNAATDILAEELASLALDVAENANQGNRKKSVTTADFFKEAHLIMEHIRTKAAQKNSISATSTDLSPPKIKPADIREELFSNDDIDRPASRDGVSPPRKRNPTLDKRVVSHLKRFADNDDSAFATNPSFHMSKFHDMIQEADLDSFVSDRSDVRILEHRELEQNNEQDEQNSLGKTMSTGGTRSSIPTNSSGTRTKAIIEPHKISHLIADTMGGMTFDHQRQCWVKRRSGDIKEKMTNRLASEMTEDDPFADIPDLIDHGMKEGFVIDAKIHTSSRPTTSYTQADPALASSGPPIDTRATSWSTAAPEKQVLTAQEWRKEQMIESALLRRGSAAVSQTASQQPRAVTVAFSSPPVRPSTPTVDEPEEDYLESIETPAGPEWNTEADRLRVKNNLSSSMVRYTPRPLSRIDEIENSIELAKSSPVGEGHMALELATPAPRQSSHNLLVPASGCSYVSMHLTPLVDFTLHQADESLNLDVQYVTQRHNLNDRGEIEDRFSLSIKDLVAKIADIEPYEPFWEHMKELDLSKNGLLTLHMLDEFCGRLESLDVDDNELGQLNGVPQMIRMLSARNNCFSDLTAWGHLYNLQYLDISGNRVESLKGFSSLFHLRELKADNNRISSLDGLNYLDGLLKLSLADNVIDQVELDDCKLSRLEVLNLSANKVVKFSGLSALASLQRLDLSKNQLETIEFDSDYANTKLKFLNLASNDLTALNVSSLQSLWDMIIDFNGISTIEGLQHHPSIRRVSWRYQHFPQATVQSFKSPIDYSCCAELKSLNLSGNRLLEFSLKEKFLNLERLDLAACGIRRLADGIGTNIPNLRLLNLNHNAIREIQPLTGIKGLSQLHLANNRLKDFRQVIDVVCGIGKRLHLLDCRSNPFNTGYYFPAKNGSTHLVVRSKEEVKRFDNDPFGDDTFLMSDANAEKDVAYLKQIDFGTSIRRRVYESLLSQNCHRLEKLDGLVLDRERLDNRDKVWERLKALGIVQSSVHGV